MLGGLVRSHLGPTDGGRGSQNLRREGTVGGGVHRLGLTVNDITGVVDSLTDTIDLTDFTDVVLGLVLDRP